MILIDYCQSNDNQKVDIVSESFPHLEDGSIKDFKNIMITQRYWVDERWNESKHFYTFETGTVLKFLSFDKLGKAHGPRRDVLFLNECNYLPYLVIDQLVVRTRRIVWLDWNPVAEFWFYTEMLGTRKDIEFIGEGGDYPPLTYLDNESLLPEEIIEIEARKEKKQWWRVYGMGLLGELEGKIYKDWKFIDEIPHTARYLGSGLDFGYTNDPTAIVDVYYHDGGYIWDELCFQKGLSNKQIADILNNRQHIQALVVADSAEPKSIDEIKSYGVNIMGVAKTRGESKSDTFVKWSIQLVQEQRISVTKRSVNIIKEYRNYLWQVDKDGKVLNEPEHEFSHTMDAGKYKMTQILGKPVVKNVAPTQPAVPYYGDREMPF